MKNEFYREFDFECPAGYPHDGGDNRTPFQRDRDRVIYSSAFRRLQSKTQVFQPGEYDFYRTRLTHSIEVAQIGRSICRHLQAQGGPLGENFFIDSDLVEAVCLAHDLGHGPFGHSGEEILNRLMADYGGFEGNAQTLRILAEIFYRQDNGYQGMAPSRACLDGVMKYKLLFSERRAADKDHRPPKNHFLYDGQKQYRDFIFGGATVPGEWRQGDRLNQMRGIECQIMDWADDTAYGLNDIADGVHAGFLTGDSIEKWLIGSGLAGEALKQVEKLVEVIRAGRFEPFLNSRIGKDIRACRLEPRPHWLADMTNRHAFQLVVEPAVREEVNVYKKLAYEMIFLSPQIEQLRHKGRQILEQLFQTHAAHYLDTPPRPVHLLPAFFEKRILDLPPEDKAGRARLLCDYLAGMTDRYAIRMWKRLYDPDFGSIADLA